MNTMKTALRLIGLAVLGASLSAHAATKLDGAQYLAEASVPLKAARAIALKAFPGTITAEELEREDGGSGLRYSFDIRRGKITQEVGVDAKSGVVLENAPEGKNPD